MTDFPLELFIAALSAFDEESATAVAREVLEAGASPAELMDEVLGPAQRWVGEQWQAGLWEPQQELRATTINQNILEAISVVREERPNDRVLVTCAEGEWHTFPATMVTRGLQIEGFAVLEMKDPVPAGQIVSAIHDYGPRWVTISCVMPANLPGVRRVASVARDAGVPVIVGGSAFTGDRAQLVGANAHAAKIGDLPEVLREVGTLTTPAPDVEHARSDGYEWLTIGRQRLAVRVAELATCLGPEARSDALWVLRSLHAALLCDDASVFKDHIDWLGQRAVSVGGSPIEPLLHILRQAVEEGPASVGAVISEVQYSAP